MTKPGPKPDPDTHLEIECPCGAKFSIYKSKLKNHQGGIRKYCSRECASQFKKKVKYLFHKVVVK